MEAQKRDMFLAMNAKNFSPMVLESIRETLNQADDSKYAAIAGIELKNPDTLLIVSVLLGWLGIDRFMVGDTGIGILKLLTCGVCGVLWLIDILSIKKKAQEYNYQTFKTHMGIL